MGDVITPYLMLAAILFCIGIYGALNEEECGYCPAID